MKRAAVALFLTAALAACLPGYPETARAPAVATELNIETIVEGLKGPWSVAAIPGGGYLVVEKTVGLKRIFPDGRIESVKGIPKDVYTEGQAGYFDVKIAPNYTDAMVVYLSYAYGTADANGTALFKGELWRPGPTSDGLTLTNTEDLFRSSPPKDTNAHFGGRIAFLDDDTVVLTLGDGFAYREEAQNMKSHLGKIVRLELNGAAAGGNPFIGNRAIRQEIYTSGHRNVQGVHFDKETGRLWAHEHGPKGGDELNLIKSARNYGWPKATTGVDYNGARITPHETLESTEPFVKDWVPSIAPSGLTIYRGSLFPEWAGDALIGGLASQDLRRVDLDGDKFVKEETVLSGLGRIRDVRTAPDGALLVIVDDPENGKLLRITPK